MAKELRSTDVVFTVRRPDDLPLRDGKEITADDVVGEINGVINAALTAWYQERGHELLTYEPMVG